MVEFNLLVLTHSIHQAVQHNVEVDALPALHQLGHHTPHLMSAETHGYNVVNDLLQRDCVCLRLSSALHCSTSAAALLMLPGC